MKPSPLQFAYWVPNVSGGLVVSKIEQRTSWDASYNRKLAQIAEQAGFDYALTQVRFTAGYGADNQQESMTFSQDLLAATQRLKVIAALLPGPWEPVLAAKQVATISQLYGPRIAVNIVSGWFRGEFKAIGQPWLDHEERYLRSEEFIRCLQGIWREESFNFSGDFYRFRDYVMKPKPQHPLPEVFQGGSSAAARSMAARVSDWYFTNGNSVEGVREQIIDIQRKAQAGQHKVRVGMNAFVIARETQQQAQAVLDEILAKADIDAVKGFHHEVQNAGNASPEKKGNWADSTFEDLVQYNDGFRPGLIGTPDEIARKILAYKQAGVDLMLLGFLHCQEDIAFFGEQVLPRVRELEANTYQESVHV